MREPYRLLFLRFINAMLDLYHVGFGSLTIGRPLLRTGPHRRLPRKLHEVGLGWIPKRKPRRMLETWPRTLSSFRKKGTARANTNFHVLHVLEIHIYPHLCTERLGHAAMQ